MDSNTQDNSKIKGSQKARSSAIMMGFVKQKTDY